MKKVVILCMSVLSSITPHIDASCPTTFVMITMLYNETDAVRMQEYIECLEKNSKHPLIATMHVLYDTSKDDSNTPLLDYLQQQDHIAVTFIQSRATYQYCIDVANAHYPDQSIILTNADIYFNETLLELLSYDLSNTFLTITRWNIQDDNTMQLTTRYGTDKPDPGSHDTWIFQTPIINFDLEGITMGIMHCDGRIAHQALQAGLVVLNPCYTIECCHLHKSPVRHYWKEKRHRGKLADIPCGTLHNVSHN